MKKYILFIRKKELRMDSLKTEWKPISVDSFKTDIQNIFVYSLYFIFLLQTSVSDASCDISQKLKEFFSLAKEEDVV